MYWEASLLALDISIHLLSIDRSIRGGEAGLSVNGGEVHNKARVYIIGILCKRQKNG